MFFFACLFVKHGSVCAVRFHVFFVASYGTALCLVLFFFFPHAFLPFGIVHSANLTILLADKNDDFSEPTSILIDVRGGQ